MIIALEAISVGEKSFMKGDKMNRAELIEAMAKENGLTKKANEDARYVLPNACETKIVVTMNIRSLFNFFKHRCCNRAQWEIREVANEMLKICYDIAPNIFRYAGPDCVAKGKCGEGKMSCGKQNEVHDFFMNVIYR